MDLAEAKQMVIEELNRIYLHWRLNSENPTMDHVAVLGDMDDTHAMVIGYIEMLLNNDEQKKVDLQ